MINIYNYIKGANRLLKDWRGRSAIDITRDTAMKKLLEGYVRDPADNSESKLCFICQKPSDKYCSACKKAYYCCVEHQKEHWKQHKLECSGRKAK